MRDLDNGKQNHFSWVTIGLIPSRKKYTLMRSICDNDLLTSPSRIDNLQAASDGRVLPQAKELDPAKLGKSLQLELNSLINLLI